MIAQKVAEIIIFFSERGRCMYVRIHRSHSQRPETRSATPRRFPPFDARLRRRSQSEPARSESALSYVHECYLGFVYSQIFRERGGNLSAHVRNDISFGVRTSGVLGSSTNRDASFQHGRFVARGCMFEPRMLIERVEGSDRPKIVD